MRLCLEHGGVSYARRAVQVPMQLGDFHLPKPVLSANEPLARTSSKRSVSMPPSFTVPDATTPKNEPLMRPPETLIGTAYRSEQPELPTASTIHRPSKEVRACPV